MPGGVQRRPDRAVPQAQCARTADVPLRWARDRARANGPPRRPHRVRVALDPRRSAPAPVVDAARVADLGHSAERGLVSGLGAPRRQQRHHHLVQPPGSGRVGRGLDPARDRDLVAGGVAGALVAPGGGCERRLGPARLGLRGSLRWHLRPGAHLALRSSRCRAHLLRGGPAGGATGTRLHDTEARTRRPRRRWCVPDRDGGVAGLAGSWLLAGPGRHPPRHGGANGPDVTARLPVLVGVLVRRLRRGPRLGCQPGRGRLVGRHRGVALERAAPTDSRRPGRARHPGSG